MKINIIVILSAITFLFLSCTNIKQNVKEDIKEHIDSTLSTHVDFFINTLPYMCDFSPSNYWYPSGTLTEKIIEDDFATGLKGLSDLETVLNNIDGNLSKEVNEKKDILLNAINKHKEQIRKFQEAKNSVSGMLSFSLDELLNTSANDTMVNNELPLYPDIVDAMDNLRSEIMLYYEYTFKDVLINIEKKSMESYGYPQFSLKDRLEIRSFLFKQARRIIRNKALNKIDTVCSEPNIRGILNDSSISQATSAIQAYLDKSLKENSNALKSLSQNEIKQLSNALLYEFSIDYRFSNSEKMDSLPQDFGMHNYEIYQYSNNPFVQVVYGFGTGSSITYLFYYFENSKIKSISKFDYTEKAKNFLKFNDITEADIIGVNETSSKRLELKGSGYQIDDAHCCPAFRLAFDFTISDNSIIIKDIEILEHNSDE